ncbi:unnamed protein product [Prunus armeniaca]
MEIRGGSTFVGSWGRFLGGEMRRSRDLVVSEWRGPLPLLDWDTVVRVLRLVWLGMLRFPGKAALGALGLIYLSVTPQCAVVMLELDVLSMKMVIFLGHFGDTGTEAL